MAEVIELPKKKPCTAFKNRRKNAIVDLLHKTESVSKVARMSGLQEVVVLRTYRQYWERTLAETVQLVQQSAYTRGNLRAPQTVDDGRSELIARPIRRSGIVGLAA